MKKYLPIIVLPPLVLALDQWTKYLINRYLLFGETVVIIPGYFDLVHVRNRGAAFGLFSEWNSQGSHWFFYLVSLVAFITLFAIYLKTKPEERKVQVPLAFIFGGAVGNLIDRLTRGSVVDFLHFHWKDQIADFTLFGRHFRFLLSWPSFNIADIAITCGAIYLAVVILFFDTKKSDTELVS